MLTLYMRTGCPYCNKVLDYAAGQHIKLEQKNIVDEATRLELIEKGGKQQVPYLVDSGRGEAMYESDEIVAYLETYYSRS